MPVDYTAADLRAIWPRAPQAVIDAFVAKKATLDGAGITASRNRFAIACAQVEHETNGFTIKDLTENINYSAGRAAQIWPGRFANASDCYRKVGSWEGDPQFKIKLIDHVYGGRMGNAPPPAHDGSRYIGRGGPQVTGKDGYAAVGVRAGLALVAQPDFACRHEYQPEILAAFWSWKNFNPIADSGGLRAVTKPWNGGYIGMADREARLAGNDPIVARLKVVERMAPLAKKLPGDVPAKPPAKVIDAATEKERSARKGGGVIGGSGLASEGANQAKTVQPDKPFISPVIAWTCIGVGAAVVIVAAILIARKRAAVIKNWF